MINTKLLTIHNFILIGLVSMLFSMIVDQVHDTLKRTPIEPNE